MNRPEHLPEKLDKKTIQWLKNFGYCLNANDETYKNIKNTLKQYYPYEYYFYVNYDVKNKVMQEVEMTIRKEDFDNPKLYYKAYKKAIKEAKKRIIKEFYILKDKGNIMDMDVFKDLDTKDQSRIMRVYLKKQRFYRGLLEVEKDRPNIKDEKQQQHISGLQTHVDIMSLAMQDLELIERYVIEQTYYDGIKQKFIAEKLNMQATDISKISSKALKKIKSNLYNMSVGVANKDKLKKGMF